MAHKAYCALCYLYNSSRNRNGRRFAILCTTAVEIVTEDGLRFFAVCGKLVYMKNNNFTARQCYVFGIREDVMFDSNQTLRD